MARRPRVRSADQSRAPGGFGVFGDDANSGCEQRGEHEFANDRAGELLPRGSRRLRVDKVMDMTGMFHQWRTGGSTAEQLLHQA